MKNLIIAGLVVSLLTGCGTIKVQHTDYYPEGKIKRKTEISYCRWFNQSLDGVEIINPLFTAKLEEQGSDNTEIVEAGTEGIVAGIGAIITP